MGPAVQPEIIHGLAMRPGFRGRGLLGRFLYSLPPSMLGRRATDPPPVPDAVRSTYHGKMTALLQQEPDTATDMWGQPEPRRLVLSPEAAARFRTFRAELEPRLGELGDLGHIADWAGKLAGAVARIAGLLHLAQYAGENAPWSLPISDDTIWATIQLGQEYLISHAQAAFALMGADPTVADAQHVLRVLADRDMEASTERELFQIVKGRFKTMERLERALAALEEHGYIRMRPEIDRPGPGRKPSPAFDVNPRWRHVSSRTQDRFAGTQLEGAEFGIWEQTPSQNAHNPQNSPSADIGRNCEDSEDCEEPAAQQEIMEWTTA
jgi:replicative DNA helicase